MSHLMLIYGKKNIHHSIQTLYGSVNDETNITICPLTMLNRI